MTSPLYKHSFRQQETVPFPRPPLRPPSTLREVGVSSQQCEPLDLSLHGVYVVGQVGHPRAKVVRIVHISDTRGYHTDFSQDLPFGHVLIHSGDFGEHVWWKDLQAGQQEREHQLHKMNYFFGRQPHPYKIFVAGNEDTLLAGMSPFEIQQRLPHAIYLQDSGCQLFGLRFYGTPWNSVAIGNLAKAFSVSKSRVLRQWKRVPRDTDILITHFTPWGSRKLYSQVAHGIKPIAHLFGDEKAGPGINWKDHVLFSNGAMYGKYACSRDGRRHSVGCTHPHWSSFSSGDSHHHPTHGPSHHHHHHHHHSQSAESCPAHRYVNMHASEVGSRPNPIVIDVYVVSDELDYVELPIYSPPTSVPAVPSSSSTSQQTQTACSSRQHVRTSSSSASSEHGTWSLFAFGHSLFAHLTALKGFGRRTRG